MRTEATSPAEPTASPRWRRAAMVRRTLLTSLVLVQTLAGSFFLAWVLPYHGGNLVEQGLILLFALLFAWISVGFWVGLFGFVIRRMGGDRHSLLHRHGPETLARQPLARTAVVMPIYHEPVERSLNGLRATYRSLRDTGQLEHFDFFILSDSRDPKVWLAEREAWYHLCEELGAGGRLFYRRRRLNQHYKSGNIADFLRRWGRDYRYTIVLDADSLMAGDTLVSMVRLMEREPRVGILQTSPTIINGRTLFARVQQFASQVYGPIFTSGLAALQLGEAAYWGHNAIIRNSPFMRHCGLRKLSGFGLFSGPISSHDFVEAAFMGRAGYEVWLEPALGGSHEESPPALMEELNRDKRWAKGNLQHLWLLLFSPRLRMAHRIALFNGVMSYLAAPLWFGFLALTTVAAARLFLLPIEYFSAEPSLFPQWPKWNPEWALGLAATTLFLLFFPKLVAAVDLAFSRRLAQHGGALRLTTSILIEMLASALLAPIRMLAHTRYVLEALLNTTLRWAGQNRSHETRWRDAFLNQSPGTLLALAWAGFAWWMDPVFFYWTLPVALPLILAAPTSVLLGRIWLGQWLRNRGLLLVGQELRPEPVLRELHRAPGFPQPADETTAFSRAVIDPVLNRMHRSCARQSHRGAKARQVRRLTQLCLEQGPDSFSRRQLSLLADDATALQHLHEQAWCARPDSYWGREMAKFQGIDYLIEPTGGVAQ
ncbi:MAG: glucans biosynthesis glucosyltransferase MdoH [Gammaproteobacteria bacterium]|nr:glucans biosynthesis glucosyltransferase MdoH [Gammaproteobacteria bacterium]